MTLAVINKTFLIAIVFHVVLCSQEVKDMLCRPTDEMSHTDLNDVSLCKHVIDSQDKGGISSNISDDGSTQNNTSTRHALDDEVIKYMNGIDEIQNDVFASNYSAVCEHKNNESDYNDYDLFGISYKWKYSHFGNLVDVEGIVENDVMLSSTIDITPIGDTAAKNMRHSCDWYRKNNKDRFMDIVDIPNEAEANNCISLPHDDRIALPLRCNTECHMKSNCSFNTGKVQIVQHKRDLHSKNERGANDNHTTTVCSKRKARFTNDTPKKAKNLVENYIGTVWIRELTRGYYKNWVMARTDGVFDIPNFNEIFENLNCCYDDDHIGVTFEKAAQNITANCTYKTKTEAIIKYANLDSTFAKYKKKQLYKLGTVSDIIADISKRSNGIRCFIRRHGIDKKGILGYLYYLINNTHDEIEKLWLFTYILTWRSRTENYDNMFCNNRLLLYLLCIKKAPHLSFVARLRIFLHTCFVWSCSTDQDESALSASIDRIVDVYVKYRADSYDTRQLVAFYCYFAASCQHTHHTGILTSIDSISNLLAYPEFIDKVKNIVLTNKKVTKKIFEIC